MENELKIALWRERSIESDTIIRNLQSKKDTQLAALKMEIDKLKMENEQSLYLALMNYFRSFNQFIIKFTIEIYSLQDVFLRDYWLTTCLHTKPLQFSLSAWFCLGPLL